MGANKATNGPGGGNNKTYSSSREIGLMNQYKKPKQRIIDTQRDKDEAFKEQGAYNTRRSLDRLPSFGPTSAILKGLSPILQKNSKRNRDFFVNRVLTDKRGLKNFGVNQKQFKSLSVEKQNEIYGKYISERRDNKTDGYGTVIREGNDNQVVQAPVATTMPVEAPSSIEVAEPVMTAEEARAKASDLIRKKRKGKGRGTLIATSPQGVTNEGLTLSDKSLLG